MTNLSEESMPFKERYADADILVVDDNLANVELLIGLLEDQGYDRLEGMTDPRRVEARVQRQCPDLILLDVRMPWLSGLEIMERLRALPREQAPAVIVLTAQIDEETRHRALELGAQDFLIKPFDHVEVLQRIHNTLDRHWLIKERSQRAVLLEGLVKERTRALEALSREDPVTGLPNRRALLEHAERLLAEGRNPGVLFIAIGGLDDIARLHGYVISDRLGMQLAQRLRPLQADADAMLGVWNSSEWVLLTDHAGSDDAHGALGETVLEHFATPFEVEDMSLQLRASIGRSAGAAAGSAEHWIRRAALALPARDGLCQAYSAELEEALRRRTRMAHALRHAIARGELHLACQPKVDLKTRTVCGAEALLRWNSAEFGPVSPAEFIPLAEASGEIVAIGAWVMHEAMDLLARWRRQAVVPPDFSLAVNAASVQLMRPEFAHETIAAARAHGVPPALLEIEVTESGLMQDMALAMTQLETLARTGFGIAIDDFGTGYSSLAYLKALPVSVLKIDRAFIRDLHTNPQDQRLTGTVIDMARHFGFRTVAEGVENVAQLERLAHMGCDVAQGFLFAPPLAEEALLRAVATGFGAFGIAD